MSCTGSHLGETCWCEGGMADLYRRENHLDQRYPDRCQVRNGEDSPAPGARLCTLEAGHVDGCFGGLERPGDACHFCGEPTSKPPNPCPRCYTPVEQLSVALLAELADMGVDITPDYPGGAT